MNTSFNLYPPLKTAFLISPFLMLPGSVLAKSEPAKTQNEQLQVINVETSADSKQNEVTGLGKIVKNTKSLNKEQVLDIRDLTRYNPEVYATEQGAGASSGYTIRGVDRNRVSISVDGIPQAQSFTDPLRTDFGIRVNHSRGSGAINEIEFENIAEVDINKGGNSAESGNGALGGSVNFSTKNVDNVLLADRKVGGAAKTAYSSKDRQFMKSLATGFRHNGFEGLLQYTHRQGHEIRAHKDADKGNAGNYADRLLH